MKKLFLLIILLLFLAGCTAQKASIEIVQNHKELMDEIPDHEFKEFKYQRTGIHSYAKIIATDAKKENGKLEIGFLQIDAKYGPEVINISVTGYGNAGTGTGGICPGAPCPGFPCPDDPTVTCYHNIQQGE